MAEVWEATDTTRHHEVAVKVLHPHLADDPGFQHRFRREGVAAARLVHPNIVAVHDVVSDGGLDAIVMEMVRGQTLRTFLDRRGRLDPVEVVLIGDEVGAALTCAHRAGLVHRDIKPANVLLADDGRLLVTDFGIAKLLDDPDLTTTSTLLGTVKYLAPEQVEGRGVDARTDVYALGAVLYECLTGAPPFGGDSPATVALARLTQVPDPPTTKVAGVAPELDAAIVRALARHPDDRFASADDLRRALRGEPARPDDHTVVPRGEPGPAVPATALVPPSPPPPSPTVDDTIVARTPPTLPPSPAGRTAASRAEPARGGRPRRATLAALILVLAALIVAATLVATTALGREVLSLVTARSAVPGIGSGPQG
jgi:serine/threonine-protein kinase